LEISEVRIRLLEGRHDRLRAYATITLASQYVVRDLRVIEGTRGVFVAMPSRRLADRCPRCGCKNHLRAAFCNDCGNRLPQGRAQRDATGRLRLHCDVCHPVNKETRELLEVQVLKKYFEDLEAKRLGQYTPPIDEEYDYEEEGGEHEA
jgi:stage V sporulation protein G